MSRALSLGVYAVALILIGCGDKTRGLETSAHSIEIDTHVVVAMNISARFGGRLALPDGLIVIFDPHALASDRYVRVSESKREVHSTLSSTYRPVIDGVDIEMSSARAAVATAFPSRPVRAGTVGAHDATTRNIWLTLADTKASLPDGDAETIVRLNFPERETDTAIEAFPVAVGDSLVVGFNALLLRPYSRIRATVWARRHEESGFGFTFLRRA